MGKTTACMFADVSDPVKKKEKMMTREEKTAEWSLWVGHFEMPRSTAQMEKRLKVWMVWSKDTGELVVPDFQATETEARVRQATLQK